MSRTTFTATAAGLCLAGMTGLAGCNSNGTVRSTDVTWMDNGQPFHNHMTTQAQTWNYQYVYHPNEQVYFEPFSGMYHWYQNGMWHSDAKLPAWITLDPKTARVVRVNTMQPHAQHQAIASANKPSGPVFPNSANGMNMPPAMAANVSTFQPQPQPAFNTNTQFETSTFTSNTNVDNSFNSNFSGSDNNAFTPQTTTGTQNYIWDEDGRGYNTSMTQSTQVTTADDSNWDYYGEFNDEPATIEMPTQSEYTVAETEMTWTEPAAPAVETYDENWSWNVETNNDAVTNVEEYYFDDSTSNANDNIEIDTFWTEEPVAAPVQQQRSVTQHTDGFDDFWTPARRNVTTNSNFKPSTDNSWGFYGSTFSSEYQHVTADNDVSTAAAGTEDMKTEEIIVNVTSDDFDY